MVTMKDIAQAIERQAPLQLQESWDNCGLQVGSMSSSIQRVLTALDVTPEVVSEAIERQVDAIVTHHPMIFKGIKSINTDTMQGKMIKDLLCHDINVYSAHTNLDVTDGGLNDEVARRLGLQDIQGLEETGRDVAYKVAVYVPVTHSEQLRQAMGDAGAGHIGAYSHCSFSVAGEGRFLPLEGTSPFIGHVGTMETVQEERVETVVPAKLLGQVLASMEKVHPYEEIAYDVVALENAHDAHYIGRMAIYHNHYRYRSSKNYYKLYSSTVHCVGVGLRTQKFSALDCAQVVEQSLSRWQPSKKRMSISLGM